MSNKENLEFEFTADMSDFNKKLDQARDDIAGFKKRIESDEAVKLSLNVARVIKKINDVKARIKEARKKGDLDAEIKFTADLKRLEQIRTQAQRELRNFARTGAKDMSVLGKLFNSVNDEIRQSRDELGKLGSKLSGLNKIEKEVKQITQEFKSGKISIEEYRRKMEELRDSSKKAGKGFRELKNTLKGAAGTLVGLFVLDKVKNLLLEASDTARSFETAFIGVRKTINGTEQDYKKIEDGLRRMTKEIPLTVEELSGIAEVGGQLGVAKEDILEFTRVSAMLGATTVLTAEEASTSFARIANVMQEPIANIEFMGSALVDLGNNFATNEAEILDFSERIAGAGAIVGMTSADIMGISSAFTSVGIEAEAGGTAVQKALLTINRAVNDGGVKLQQFAEISGMSAKEFARLWREDAGAGFTKFVNGLSKSGQQADQILAEMLGTDVRLARAFLSVANAGDLLNKTMKTSNEAFEKGTALQEEFDKRLKSTDSQLKIQANRWRLWGEQIGKNVTPALIKINDILLETLPKTFNLIILGIQIFVSFFIEQFYKAKLGVKSFVIGSQKLFNSFVGFLKDVGHNTGVFVRNAKASFVALGHNIKAVFKNIYENGKIAISNLGESFKLLPLLVVKGVNGALAKIESFLNKIVNGVNNSIGGLLDKVGIGRLNNITMGRVSTEGFTPNYKSLIKLDKDFQETKWENFTYLNKKIADAENSNLEAEMDRYRSKIQADINFNRTRIKLAIKDTAKKNKAIEAIEKKATEKRKKEIKKELQDQINKTRDILGKIKDLEEDSANGGAGAKSKRNHLEKEYQKQLKKTIDLLKDKAKVNSETYKEIIKDIEKGVKGLGKYIDKIIKTKEEIKKFKTEAIKSLRDVNNELAQQNQEKENQLAERRVEILEKQRNIQKELTEKQKEYGIKNLSRYDGISNKSLEIIGDGDMGGGITGNQILELRKLRDELESYNSELELIKRNASEQTLKQVENYNNLTEAEKILFDQEKKRAELLEKKSIYEAIINGEKINLDEIKNYNNLKLAEELMDKQEKLNQELELEKQSFENQKQLLKEKGILLKDFKEKEMEQYKQMLDGKKEAEIEFTKFLAEEQRKRLKLRQNLGETIRPIADNLTNLKTSTTEPSKEVSKKYEFNFDNVTVREESDIESIANKVYEKIENETEVGNKNFY